MHSNLRALRTKAGLAQQELARLIGVSRQTLTALEAGDSVPATKIALQLARVLGCRVEDIFWLEEPARPIDAVVVENRQEAGARNASPRMPARARREGAAPALERVALAQVGARWVAHLLDDPGGNGPLVPADGLAARAGGAASVSVQPLREEAVLRENLFAAGCDPALALLAAHLEERWKGGRLHWLPAASGRALDLLAAGEVHLAGLHLFDEESGGFNVAPARRRLGGQALVLVNLATWEQGLVVVPGNARKIRRVKDLAGKGVRVVGREPGSGASELLHRLAAEEGVPRKAIDVVAVAAGHLAVAQMVAAGAADAGISTQAAAIRCGLEFVPLDEARFDLGLPRPVPGRPPAATDARHPRQQPVPARPRRAGGVWHQPHRAGCRRGGGMTGWAPAR